jgi:hypothetical protein
MPVFSTELSTRGLWCCAARSGNGALVKERRASEGDREAGPTRDGHATFDRREGQDGRG